MPLKRGIDTGIIVLKGHLKWNVAPAVKQPPSVTSVRSPNMQPIAHSNRICKRFQLWKRVAWLRRFCAPSASKHSASLQIKVCFSIRIKGRGSRRDFCFNPNSDKPKPKRFKHEGHKGHEGRPLIKLCVLRVLCVWKFLHKKQAFNF
jgi:hypothetical protein